MPQTGSVADGTRMAVSLNAVDAYIESAPATQQPRLREVREIIRSTAPAAVEKLSYGMPFYEYSGQRLVYFAGHKGHVGVYAIAHVDGQAPDELKPYLDHRSTLRLPFDGPLPVAGIRIAIRRRLQDIESKEESK